VFTSAKMGAVPLLTREGEVDLARRMERGKLRMPERSAVPPWYTRGGGCAEQLKKAVIEIRSGVDLGDVEEGSRPTSKGARRRGKHFADIVLLHKKLQQLEEKVETTPSARQKSPASVSAPS